MLPQVSASGLDHRALIYRDDEELVATAAEHLRAGLEQGDAVLIVAGGARGAGLREALADGDGRVSVVAPETFYATPVGALAHWSHQLAAQPPAGRLRAVADVHVGAPPGAGPREWAREEAVFSAAFAHARVNLLCTYDARLGDEVLAGARATHARLVEDGASGESPAWSEPLEFLRALDADPLPAPRGRVDELRFDGAPAVARRFAAEHARMAGLSGERLDDARVAVTEIATNAVLHGRPPHVIRSWQQDGSLFFEIQDAGPGIDSPLTGFLQPRVDAPRGRGVWIARRVCDLVEIRGAQVRLQLVL
jgi:anti-sigma regulatory factor (Ser/Thr protein kinase)